MDILETKIDSTITIRQANATLFLQWVLQKVNDAHLSNNNTVRELNGMANFYPGRLMTDDQKMVFIKKMQAAGIVI